MRLVSFAGLGVWVPGIDLGEHAAGTRATAVIAGPHWPPQFLKTSDRVEVAIEGMGSPRNTAAERV